MVIIVICLLTEKKSLILFIIIYNYIWNPSTCICENSRYLKSIVCDEIINVTDGGLTNVTNTIPTNVTSTVSINSDDKK